MAALRRAQLAGITGNRIRRALRHTRPASSVNSLVLDTQKFRKNLPVVAALFVFAKQVGLVPAPNAVRPPSPTLLFPVRKHRHLLFAREWK
jgi:hypothetical protein